MSDQEKHPIVITDVSFYAVFIGTLYVVVSLLIISPAIALILFLGTLFLAAVGIGLSQ